MTFLNKYYWDTQQDQDFARRVAAEVKKSMGLNAAGVTGRYNVSTATAKPGRAHRGIDPAGNLSRSSYGKLCCERADRIVGQLLTPAWQSGVDLLPAIQRIAEVRVCTVDQVLTLLEAAVARTSDPRELSESLLRLHRNSPAPEVLSCASFIEGRAADVASSLMNEAGWVLLGLRPGTRLTSADVKRKAFALTEASGHPPRWQLGTMRWLTTNVPGGSEFVTQLLSQNYEDPAIASKCAALFDAVVVEDQSVAAVMAANPDVFASGASLDEEKSNPPAESRYDNTEATMEPAASINDPATDMDVTFPTEITDMKYHSHAAGLKEANTGRQLYLRKNGRRVSLFDGKGTYVMDINREALATLAEQLNSIKGAIAEGTYESYLKVAGRPALGHGVADSTQYPGQVLSGSVLAKMGKESLSLACSINGIAASPEPEVMRQRLLRHAVFVRETVGAQVAQNNRALREERDLLTARVQELTSDKSAEKSSLPSELRELQRVNTQLVEQCERLRRDQCAMQRAVSGARRAASELEEAHERQGGELASLRSRVAELEGYEETAKNAQEIERLGNEALQKAHVFRLEAEENRARSEVHLAEIRALDGQDEKVRKELNAARARIRVLERKQQLALPAETNTDMDTQNIETEMEFPAAPVTAPSNYTPEPVRPGSPVVNMFTDALQLAAVQQSSKLLVDKVTPLAIKAGVNEDFIKNPQVRGILELALPFMLSQYAHMVPGLKKMDALPQLSHQQLVMGLADVIGISIQQLLGIGVEVIGALNAGADSDPLKAAKDLLEGDAGGAEAAE